MAPKRRLSDITGRRQRTAGKDGGGAVQRLIPPNSVFWNPILARRGVGCGSIGSLRLADRLVSLDGRCRIEYGFENGAGERPLAGLVEPAELSVWVDLQKGYHALTREKIEPSKAEAESFHVG